MLQSANTVVVYAIYNYLRLFQQPFPSDLLSLTSTKDSVSSSPGKGRHTPTRVTMPYNSAKTHAGTVFGALWPWHFDPKINAFCYWQYRNYIDNKIKLHFTTR